MDLFGIPIEREVIARLKALADADRARPIHERRFTARGVGLSPRSVARHLILNALFVARLSCRQSERPGNRPGGIKGIETIDREMIAPSGVNEWRVGKGRGR